MSKPRNLKRTPWSPYVEKTGGLVSSGQERFELFQVRTLEELGLFFRQRRTERKRTLKSVANVLGVDESTIARVELGYRAPSIFLCERLAEEYNLSKTTLIYVLKTLQTVSSPRSPLETFRALSTELTKEVSEGTISFSVAKEIADDWAAIVRRFKQARLTSSNKGGAHGKSGQMQSVSRVVP